PLPPGSAYKWDVMIAALAAQEPWWEPGTMHGYHAHTYGWLVGEVIRRVSRKSPGRYLREEIAGPLGLDFHIGLAESEHRRVAEIVPPDMPVPDEPNPLAERLSDPNSMAFKAIANPPELGLPGSANTSEWRAAELPAANGHGNARGLARLYGALARGGEIDGVRVLTPEANQRATEEQCQGPDAILGVNMRWALGFALNPPDEKSLGPNPRAFGHSGWGGSLGFADPDARMGFGYAMNKMLLTSTTADPRWKPLIDAVYSSL
ncbi:MAG: beta-lactamase family protein, partial [Chloroflexi bacterium]